jgi:hypothetical protein
MRPGDVGFFVEEFLEGRESRFELVGVNVTLGFVEQIV